MTEPVLRLAAELRFEACADGRCKIVHRTGDAYTFAGSQRGLFERLWRGLSVAEVRSASQERDALDGWLLSLRDLGLVETAILRRDSDIPWAKTAGSGALFMPWPHVWLALWGLVLAGLCLEAILHNGFNHSLPMLSFAHLVVIAMSWCGWIVLHEAAHGVVARWHGVSGRIEFFRHGMLAPRFHAPVASERASARVRYAIYIAGPLLDGAIVLLLLLMTKIESNVWFGWTSAVASVFCAFSLLPLKDGDARNAWDCLDRSTAQRRRRYSAFFLVYSSIACFCLAMTSTLCIEMLFHIAPVHGWLPLSP